MHGPDLERMVLLLHALSTPMRHFEVERDMPPSDAHGDTRDSPCRGPWWWRPGSGSNVSGRGAKVGPTERLGEGSVAQLHFHPPDGPSLDVEAIVWRVDRDGLAFFFTDDHQRRLTTLLAQLAGVPPALWTTPLN